MALDKQINFELKGLKSCTELRTAVRTLPEGGSLERSLNYNNSGEADRKTS
jgi:hypothetical protein